MSYRYFSHAEPQLPWMVKVPANMPQALGFIREDKYDAWRPHYITLESCARYVERGLWKEAPAPEGDAEAEVSAYGDHW